MHDFETLMESQKYLASARQWTLGEKGGSGIWLDAPLEVDGSVPLGLYLHCQALKNVPDCNVGFELSLRLEARRMPLARFDWKSLKGGHTNPRRPGIPPHLSGRRVKETHFHAFDLNWLPDVKRMRHGLPVAMDFEVDFVTFEEARNKAGELLKINNIDLIKAPEWEYDLPHGY